MKRALALLLSATACAQPPAWGGGVVSTNPCADAMLVRLVEPERIAAISHYSHDAQATSLPLDVARRFRATAGTAEEVVAMRPDLVLASSFTPPSTRAAFERAGLRTVYLDSPVTVAASKAQVNEVAMALGEPERGRALVREIDRAITTSVPPRRRPGPSSGTVMVEAQHEPTTAVAIGPRPSPGWKHKPAALLYITGELANGSGTLLDELLTRAGFENAAARYGLRYTGTLPAELTVSKPPDVILTPDPGGRVVSMRARLLPNTPVAHFPRELVNCGGPSIAPALKRLAEIRASLR